VRDAIRNSLKKLLAGGCDELRTAWGSRGQGMQIRHYLTPAQVESWSTRTEFLFMGKNTRIQVEHPVTNK